MKNSSDIPGVEFERLTRRTKEQRDHLKAVTQMSLWRAARRCEYCGVDVRSRRYAAHHITYERQGNEDYRDLRILCAPCHTRWHSVRSKVKSAPHHRTRNKNALRTYDDWLRFQLRYPDSDDRLSRFLAKFSIPEMCAVSGANPARLARAFMGGRPRDFKRIELEAMAKLCHHLQARPSDFIHRRWRRLAEPFNERVARVGLPELPGPPEPPAL